MIRLDEKRVPGYLRAGKILGLMGKWEAALGMYRYGLERVPGGDEERKVCLCHAVGGFVFRVFDIGFAVGSGAVEGGVRGCRF